MFDYFKHMLAVASYIEEVDEFDSEYYYPVRHYYVHRRPRHHRHHYEDEDEGLSRWVSSFSS